MAGVTRAFLSFVPTKKPATRAGFSSAYYQQPFCETNLVSR